MNWRSGLNSMSRNTGLPSLTGTLSYTSAGRDGLTELIRIWQNKSINISLISHNTSAILSHTEKHDTRPNAFIMWKHKHHYNNDIRPSGRANRREYNHLCVSQERIGERMRAGIKSLIQHQSLRTTTRGLHTLAANWIIQWRQTQLLHRQQRHIYTGLSCTDHTHTLTALTTHTTANFIEVFAVHKGHLKSMH